MNPRWLMFHHAILRSTGFDWGLLDALDHPLTEVALTELDRAEAALTHAVGGVVASVRSTPDSLSPSQSRKLRRSLSRRRRLAPELLGGVDDVGILDAAREYERRLDAVANATLAAQRQLAGERAASHKAMVELAQDPAVREAVWLCSPAMHDRGLTELAELAADPSRGQARGSRRQFGGYLQRLAAKNETASFFGPITYADFTAEPDGAEPVTAGPVRRAVSMAYWAVLRLADAVAADPRLRPHLRPRASGLLTSTDPASFGGRALDVPAALRELIRAADGQRSVHELASRLSRPTGEVLADVERLTRSRVLMLDCRPPVTEPDALGWLRAFVRTLPGGAPWGAALDQIAGCVTEFATARLDRRRELLADLESRIAAVSPGPVRRGGGWYTDRLVVHEEALGDLSPLALGGALRERLRDRLAPALDLLAAEAVARHAALTARFLDRHPALAEGRSVPLLTLLRSASDPDPQSGPLTAAGHRVAELVDRADPDSPLRIEPAALPAVDLGHDPLIASPDLMFAASGLSEVLAGRGQVVLAECHDTMMIWGWALQLHPRRREVELAAERLLHRASGATTMAVVLGSRRAKIMPFDFPGPVIELGGAVPAGDRPRAPIADVSVRLRGCRLVATAPGVPDFLLHHGELDSAVHNVLAPPRIRPVRFGSARRTPRILLGDVVIARAQWILDRDELFPRGGSPPDELGMLRHVRRTAVEHGIPRRCFARVPGERKPILVDLRAPALLDLAWHLSRHAERIVLTEMFPGPDELWLNGQNGRHCAELRTTVALDREAV